MAFVALFLAAVGIYGVIAQIVAERSREIGIRLALGAERGRVVGMIVGDCMRSVAAGVAIGFGVALGAAGVMLAASAAAEVQRRGEAIGILRALGATPVQVANGYALESAALAAPAAAVGLLGGRFAVAGPTSRLLDVLNELMPGTPAQLALLAVCWLGAIAVVAAATWIPVWRAARRPAVESLRGSDVVRTPRRVPLPALPGFGARLALARPFRAAALVAVLSASAAVVLLMLTIATVLHGLEHDAQTLGTRYQLTVPAAETSVARIRETPGVADAVTRYETDAADSFDLGESFQLIAFPGGGTRFEAPPLAIGRRVRASDETDVGLGLAQALDLHLGATLAAQLPSGREARFRVVGIVEALRNQGLLAYVQPPRLRAAMPDVTPDIAVKLRPGADLNRVRNVLLSRGVESERTGGIADESGVSGSLGRTSFLRVLAALLRSVAFLDGLVCVYALAQMLALIARERRRAVAIVRAIGAGRAQVLAVFAGSALLVAMLAAPIGIAVERLVLGPEVARLAVSYVTLSLRAGAQPIVLVLGGLAIAVLAASGWATRAATADAIVVPLREE
jgi:ABC-type lipoprotein release transport system permease subunit